MSLKRRIILISVLFLVCILMLISSTVFQIKKIDVAYSGSVNHSSLTSVNIINQSKLEKNKSIFFADKKEAVSKLEKNLPYIKAEQIESVFPNKIIIHVSERVPLFQVEYDDGINLKFYIFDSELKLLNISDNNPNLFGAKSLAVSSYYAGDFYKNNSMQNFIKHCASYNFDTTAINLKLHTVEFNNSDIIIVSKNFATYTVKDFADDFKEKMRYALSRISDVAYDTQGQSYTIYKTISGSITVI